MPSVATGCMSAALVSTQLCPMAALAILPTCFRCTVNSLQLASTTISLVLNCMASLLSTVVSHCAASTGKLAADSRMAREALTNMGISSNRATAGRANASDASHRMTVYPVVPMKALIQNNDADQRGVIKGSVAPALKFPGHAPITGVPL